MARKPKPDGVTPSQTRTASPSTSNGDRVAIGESDKAKLRQLSKDLESIKESFGRLFSNDVTATAWTYRKFFPHRRPTPPKLGPMPEHSFVSRHKGFQLAAGVSVDPVYCNPNDPAPTETFFDSNGQPWPMIARQGWRDQMSILSDGDRQQRFAETLKKANTIVFDYWSFFRTTFFRDSNEQVFASAELWACVVNEVAERAGLSTLPRPNWQVNCSGGWIPANDWRDRKKLFPLDDFPGYITPEDEERVGEIPEIVIAERKAFIQDSEAAAGWLIEMINKMVDDQSSRHNGGNMGPTTAGHVAAKSDDIEGLKESHRLAYLAYQLAADGLGTHKPTDREAFDFLVEAYGDSSDYKPPGKFDTFARYLQAARNHLGESKNRRRGGRAEWSRSIVRTDEI